MITYDNLYCKLFIDTGLNKGELLNAIKEHTGGVQTGHEFISAGWAAIGLDENDEYDSALVNDQDHGFLYYPFLIDIEPEKSVDLQTNIKEIKKLIAHLTSLGFKVTAACDFEDELKS